MLRSEGYIYALRRTARIAKVRIACIVDVST
jgi:hypothetical protein